MPSSPPLILVCTLTHIGAKVGLIPKLRKRKCTTQREHVELLNIFYGRTTQKEPNSIAKTLNSRILFAKSMRGIVFCKQTKPFKSRTDKHLQIMCRKLAGMSFFLIFVIESLHTACHSGQLGGSAIVTRRLSINNPSF